VTHALEKEPKGASDAGGGSRTDPGWSKPNQQPYAIESVDNALRILLMLRSSSAVRVTDVSQRLGVARSTAHRLLTTLAGQGFVSQHPTRRIYVAGRVLVEIGLTTVGNLDVRRAAHGPLRALAAELNETTNLMVLSGTSLTRFIDGVEGQQPIRVGTRTGVVMPSNATSGGKVLLADLPDTEIRATFADGVPGVTRRTIVAIDALLEEVAVVRDQGFALNVGETEPGLHAAAVPVRVGDGPAVAALAVATPGARMGKADVPRFVEALRRTAQVISAELL
jgi:DNA-binding IclR family transcriptional regulator